MESRPYAANRIVGRDGEMQRLAGVLGAGDGARVALVGGEAGIGKTRLVSDALASSTPSGALVIALRGDPVRRSKAFDAFTSAVEAHVRDWTSVPPALEPRRAEVSRLLAGVTPRSTRARASDDSTGSVESLERAAIDVLRHLAPDLAPVIVYADDLHWIDPETIGIVHQLVLGVPGLDDAVVIGTYRPDGLLSARPCRRCSTRSNGARTGSTSGSTVSVSTRSPTSPPRPLATTCRTGRSRRCTTAAAGTRSSSKS